MKVAFYNLKIIHNQIKMKFSKKIIILFQRIHLFSDEVKDFEQRYAKYSKSKYTISCSNGTVALELVSNIKNDRKIQSLFL